MPLKCAATPIDGSSPHHSWRPLGTALSAAPLRRPAVSGPASPGAGTVQTIKAFAFSASCARERGVSQLDRITQEPCVRGGTACIRGMRVTVGMVVGQIGAGRSIDDILADYSSLEREDILQALLTGDPNRACGSCLCTRINSCTCHRRTRQYTLHYDEHKEAERCHPPGMRSLCRLRRAANLGSQGPAQIARHGTWHQDRSAANLRSAPPSRKANRCLGIEPGKG